MGAVRPAGHLQVKGGPDRRRYSARWRVFAGVLGGHLDGSALRERFYAALERAGLGAMRAKPEPVTFHDLRHTFGTLAVQAFPLSEVKAYMRYADIQTTMIYVHHVPRRDAAAKLSAIVGADTGIEDDVGVVT